MNWKLTSLAIGGAIMMLTSACSTELNFDRDLDDMVCDSQGCYTCEDDWCEEYRCNVTDQCPIGRVCGYDQRCIPGDAGDPGGERPDDPSNPAVPDCKAHTDCDTGEICLLDGTCVDSPNGPGDPGLPDHPDDACTHNADCGLDGICLNGGCFFPCAADDSCPPGQACDAGQCTPSDVPENTCTFNGECGPGHVCLNGACLETCSETFECSEHTLCDSGLCQADTSPVIQCSGSGSCNTNQGCVDGKCLNSCDAETPCGSSETCGFGYCQQVVTCFDTDDCGGSDCQNGMCVE